MGLLQNPTSVLILHPFSRWPADCCSSHVSAFSIYKDGTMTLAAIDRPTEFLRALPGDDVRQLLWRFAGRYDLQMLVQSVRAVARGPVSRLVAQGARNT